MSFTEPIEILENGVYFGDSGIIFFWDPCLLEEVDNDDFGNIDFEIEDMIDADKEIEEEEEKLEVEKDQKLEVQDEDQNLEIRDLFNYQKLDSICFKDQSLESNNRNFQEKIIFDKLQPHFEIIQNLKNINFSKNEFMDAKNDAKNGSKKDAKNKAKNDAKDSVKIIINDPKNAVKNFMKNNAKENVKIKAKNKRVKVIGKIKIKKKIKWERKRKKFIL